MLERNNPVSWPCTHTHPVLTVVLAQFNLHLISVQTAAANQGFWWGAVGMVTWFYIYIHTCISCIYCIWWVDGWMSYVPSGQTWGLFSSSSLLQGPLRSGPPQLLILPQLQSSPWNEKSVKKDCLLQSFPPFASKQLETWRATPVFENMATLVWFISNKPSFCCCKNLLKQPRLWSVH